MSNIIDLNKTKRLFAEDKRDKLIANKRKKTIKLVKYFFGRRVS